MLHRTDLYYFSPTGGTLEVAENFCKAIATNVNLIDLGAKNGKKVSELSDLTVVAAPVFGGRIPELVVDRLSDMDGNGKKAVALVVYGVRAYEDALWELSNTLTERGFQVVAAGAFIARHSIVPEVGAGRPDEQDCAEIQNLAEQVLKKIANGAEGGVEVPGNHPYKDRTKASATPISMPSCAQCGKCVGVCPTDAIKIEEGALVTSAEKCILCMACVKSCPQQIRMLPPQMQEAMNQKLGALVAVRRANEYFI